MYKQAYCPTVVKDGGGGRGGGVCNPTFGFRDVIVVRKDKTFNEHPVMHATGRQKCSMIMIWCNCRFCLCPVAKVLVMFTCKIHFIRSPGAIIAVVQTPAKNPEVRIWKYLSKKLTHYIVIYYYAYYAFHEKWTCTIDGKNKQKCSFGEGTIKYHMYRYAWMDGWITTLWIFKANKCQW